MYFEILISNLDSETTSASRIHFAENQIVFQISIHHFGSAIFDFEILISNLDSASSKSQNGKSVSFTSRYNFLFPRINFSLRIIFSLEIGQKV